MIAYRLDPFISAGCGLVLDFILFHFSNFKPIEEFGAVGVLIDIGIGIGFFFGPYTVIKALRRIRH